MDFFGTDNNLLEEEKNFFDVKTEMEDFVASLNEKEVGEFKNQMVTILRSLESSFDNVSNTKRHLRDIQEKLKRNLRNKNEVTKNYEDDKERYNNLKNEFENYYFKIDEKKFEETEKDKNIKQLNEEIITLNQKQDQESFANFKPQELEIKQKLFQEKEDLENKIALLEEKKRQQMLLENQLIDEKSEAERIGEDYNQALQKLDEQIKTLNATYLEEKTKKKTNDDKLAEMKEQNTKLKNDISKIQEESQSLALHQEHIQKILDELMAEKHEKNGEVNTLKNKIIPDLRRKIEENKTKKVKQLEETLIDLKKEKVRREKDCMEYKKEINKFLIVTNENKHKIRELDREIEKLVLEKKGKQDDLEVLELEIRKMKSEYLQVKAEMSKNVKLNDEKKRELENIANEIKEIDTQNINLENANHRAVNETYGIKRETLSLELVRENIEKEKNLYAKQASDANMEHTQALEKLKNLNEAISALKERNIGAETKLKQQKKIYEALKADSNRFEKKHQEAQREIKEILEEKMKKETKYNSLKIELDYKQGVIKDTEEKVEGFQEAVEKSVKEVEELKESCKNYKQSIEKYIENNTNLKKLTSAAELDYQNQKKEYNVVIREKDFIEQQLIQRNKEITCLYEKIKVLQQELFKMHQQYENKILEIEKLKSTREFLYEELEKTEHIIKNIFDLKVIKIKLEKEVLTAKNKVRSLEDETKKPLNIHRWTKLEYSDPEKYEIICQINSLQRRLIAKTEEVNQKEDLIQEKEKLYIKLKGIVARQSGVEMEEPLAKYQQKIKEETNRLKKLKEDIKNYRMDIRNYEFEIRRIDSEVDKLKQQWFNTNRQSNREAHDYYNNIIEDDVEVEDHDNNENDNDGDYYEDNNGGDDFEPDIEAIGNIYKNKVNSV